MAREVDEKGFVDFGGISFGLLQVEESFETVGQVEEVGVFRGAALGGAQSRGAAFGHRGRGRRAAAEDEILRRQRREVARESLQGAPHMPGSM